MVKHLGLNSYAFYCVGVKLLLAVSTEFQIRVGRLAPISKHREELKLRGEAKHF